MNTIRVEIRKKDFENQRCCICQGESDPGRAVKTVLKRYDYNIEATVCIPRCNACARKEKKKLCLYAIVGAVIAMFVLMYMWEDHDIFPLLGLTAVVWFGATFLLYIMMSLGGSENVFKHYDVVRFMKYRGWEYFDDDDGVGAVNILAPAAVEQMLEEIRQECGCEVIFK